MDAKLILLKRNYTQNLIKIGFSNYHYLNEWNFKYWIQWHTKYWYICIPISLIYILTVYIGVKIMKNLNPFNLRFLLGIWSAILGAFSICGSYYFVPEILSSLYNDGFHSTACDNKYSNDLNYIFWSWLFTWSKVLEFGDTIFIILRKQKLTFLHWFHHAMTVICVFSYFPNHCSINRWTGSMNYFIHSIMYTYYSLKAFKILIPKFIPVIITISQIAQMFIGSYIAGYIFIQNYNNQPCKMSLKESLFSILIYTIYFILFLNFFLQTYLNKSKNLTKTNNNSLCNSNKNSCESQKIKTN